MNEARNISEMDFQLIESHLTHVSRRFKDKIRSRTFLRSAVAFDREVELAEAETCITDDPSDRGIDAVYISEEDGYAEIYFYQAKYRETRANCGKPVPEAEAHKFQTFFVELMDQTLDLESTCFALADKVKTIWNLFSMGIECHFIYVICTNGRGLQDSSKTHFANLKARFSKLSVSELTSNDFLGFLTSRNRRPEEGQISALGREYLLHGDGDIRGILACVDAKSFVQMML